MKLEHIENIQPDVFKKYITSADGKNETTRIKIGQLTSNFFLVVSTI